MTEPQKLPPVPILSWPKWLGANLLLALTYAAVGYFSLLVASGNGQYAAFWPAAGIAIAALYHMGWSLAPGVFVGTVVLTRLSGLPWEVNLLIAAGNTAEAVVAATLLRKLTRFNPRINRVGDVLQIVFFGALLPSMISAGMGLFAFRFGNIVTEEVVWKSFFVWWAANVAGILALTPGIFSWAHPGLPPISMSRKIEGAIAFVAGTALTWAVFCRPTEGNPFATLDFAIYLFVIWMALRFSQRYSSTLVFIISSLVIWGSLQGLGPFGIQTVELDWDNTYRAQVFVIIGAVISVLISATTTNLFERSRRLENSERRYRQLFNSSPDPLWIYNPQTEAILAVNERAISRLGYSRDEFLGLKVTDLFTQEDDLPSLQSSGDWETEIRLLKTRQGGELQVRLTMRPADFFGESAIQLLAQDVTDQVRAESDLRRAEQRLNLHIQQTALGVIEWNDQFEVTEWNPAAERIFGYTKEEVLGKPGTEVIVPQDIRPLIEKVWEKICQSAEPVRSVNDNITKDGERIICEWFNTPLVGKDGRVMGAASLVQDVTLRESIRVSMRESEEKFRSVIESSPMGIQIYEMRDAEHLVLIGANAAAQNFMGFKNEDLLGKTIEEAFPALAGTEIPRMYRRAATEGKASWTDQVIYDGGEMRGAYEVNAFQTVPGKMVAMFLDITERRRTEQALRLRDKAMEAISQGIVIINRQADGSLPIIYANPAFEKITGYQQEQIIGKSWKVLTGLESEVAEVHAMEKAISREHPVSVEMRSYRQDGTTFQSAISFSPILDADGKVSHYVGVYTDVTSIKKLETQFRQSQKMEAIGRLAGGVAHDFNNLLTAIIGYNDINMSMMERNSTISNNSGEIQKAAERAASLTGQMLAFSRQQNLQPSRVPLNKVIGGMYQMLARLIGETIEIRTLLDDSLSDIKAGASQIEQVILNLAINARDAMPAGGVLSIRTANITVGFELVADVPGITPGDYVLLSLSDTGTGMDDHTKEHLFEPFFTTKEKGRGTGLGLATCYGIITQSGGYVAVHSRLGKGTTFDIYFPKMTSEGSRETTRIPEVKVQGGKETLLVVEDDPAVRPLTTNILRTLGYTVHEAGNGIEAQELLITLAGTKIDLLLTDVVMPKMGGKELADWMKVEYISTKILFASGYLENMLSREDIGENEAFFLRKPFTARTLAKKVREVLDLEIAEADGEEASLSG